MPRCIARFLPLVSLTALSLALSAAAQTPQPRAAEVALPQGEEYRTVATAVTTKVVQSSGPAASVAGFLGVAVTTGSDNHLVVESVLSGSPGEKAGVKPGDQVTRIGTHSVQTPSAFAEWLLNYGPGDEVRLAVIRAGQNLDLTAKLVPISRPMTKGAGEKAATQAEKNKDGADKKDPAEKAEKGFKGGKGGGGGKGNFTLPLWTKPVFRLAVIPIDFPDFKHNESIKLSDWQDALFSKGQYFKKNNATGQPVYGSLNDYFLEQSGSVFRIEGSVFDWVRVEKKRADYAPGNGTNNKTAVLLEALGKAAVRDGKNEFKDFDGFVFLYAGDVPQKMNQGNVYFPHVGTLTHNDKRYTYLFTCEGGSKMNPVGGFAKLAAMALGLPDLAAKKEQGGYRGLGNWCALTQVAAQEARPQHLSAWAKEKMGWLQPAVIDPTVKQKLVLAPIEDSPKECFKVLVRPNGSEYYLLENRRKKGFDANLPGEGLLIYRVLNDRPLLCEAHGLEGPLAPTTQTSLIPFPVEGNNAFTPETIPSSRSPLGGGMPVYITEIRKLEDGKIAFSIGYEFR